MFRVGGLLALLAVLVVLIDPVWCADGCTDAKDHAQSDAGAPCAICQRSVMPVALVIVPVRTVEATAAAAAPTPSLPVGWHPRIERPPRLA
jgi:hypothetical protein